MRDLIKHIIKEETNKSVKLIRKYYDIEGDGATYRGDNLIQTLVTFFPKDYDNEMSDHAGSSICNWEFEPPYNLIRKHMSLPPSSFIPLMDYIGDTEDLEDYLESMHRTEAEKFILRIKHRRENPLNEENDMSGMSKENIKLKNLLKKVLENKELGYSFKDRTEGVWDGNDYEIIDEDYTFKYHMIVNYVLGVGSGSVADIDVIIDDIIVDGESVYDGWVEIGYSENAWYIDKLHDHLNDEFFNSFPFSIYPTFYGHNEER